MKKNILFESEHIKKMITRLSHEIIEKNNKIFSNGGRVLNITSAAENLSKARGQSLMNLKKINWTDGFFRKDIGWKAIKKNENNKRQI